MVAVTLIFRKGYFFQDLSPDGYQTEQPVRWNVGDYLQELPERIAVHIESRKVQVRAWKFDVQGISGFHVPVYLLDTDLEENGAQDRTLTHTLYGGDQYYRLCQELVLGIGGVRMLRALGHRKIERFHMNEGHSSLLTLELLNERAAQKEDKKVDVEDVKSVHDMCIFTTHTPVAAGHDQFPMDMVKKVIAHPLISAMEDVFCFLGNLNMTYLALNLSRYVNGVAKKHGEVSRLMFAPYMIDSITNGVHAATWISPPFQELFNRYIPGWREDNFSLRYALNIPKDEIWKAHSARKLELIKEVNSETNLGMDLQTLTLGFARRATQYKRPTLLFEDLTRLKQIIADVGAIQLIYAGKAHPRDQQGKEAITEIFQARNALKDHMKIAFLENYDIRLANLITAGVDVWLNTPEPPHEASGTSGMKAALNGIPSLSILDGWWIEGCIEGVTGWAIGDTAAMADPGNSRDRDAHFLYDKLAKVVVPMYYRERESFLSIMQHSISLNGSFFNTQRMVQQYVVKAYFG
jgi:starch phosphorylase